MSRHITALAALAAVAAFSVSACNTVRGAGEDLQQAGSAVAEEAEETHDELTDGNPNTP